MADDNDTGTDLETIPNNLPAVEREIGRVEEAMADTYTYARSPRVQARATALYEKAEQLKAAPEGAQAHADQADAVQLSDADADAVLTGLADAGAGAVAAEWAADLGTGASARNALRVGEDQRQKLMAAFGESAPDVETAFSGLEENVRMAVYREMANTYTERQPPASKEDMEKFSDTEHGRMLVAEWGFEAPRRVATALHRWSRMTIFLTDQESDSLHDHFWRMSASERAAIVGHLGGE